MPTTIDGGGSSDKQCGGVHSSNDPIEVAPFWNPHARKSKVHYEQTKQPSVSHISPLSLLDLTFTLSQVSPSSLLDLVLTLALRFRPRHSWMNKIVGSGSPLLLCCVYNLVGEQITQTYASWRVSPPCPVCSPTGWWVRWVRFL